ncbi:Bug family tripartite tricarboxylate transporter substrate binding protein [Ramlibacter albus]|uniref:Tripartite tricarboxylate transporter substrate binding protein n=1 Tax=Ramlibacter albus TaxID=2079448 RepID=A0A923S086_9BURK|nr:tripartite tricarboxylate transporter substrate binding protein [Ramlibacter albus]MBC5762936.1 tripartite tricarboxylate transporter substrate binding protein [Ramlibacter albus]
MFRMIKTLLGAALSSAFVFAPAQAQEASWPNRPIKLIVGLTPGASSDTVAREFAKGLGERLKVSVVVENRPGANTIIASNLVAKAPADGYTFLISSSMNATNPWVYEKLPYDYRKDLKNIVLLGEAPNLMAASSKVPVNNLTEMIAYAKKNPGKFSYGSAGVGSVHHLLMEIVAKRSGIEVNHIPYKGGSVAIQDVIGGNLDSYFGTISSTRNFIQRGDMKALFVTSEKRSKYMPNVGSLEEHGLKGLNSGYWLGVAAPAGVPDAIIQRFNREANEVLKSQEVIDRLERQAIDVKGGSVADMERFFERELEFWKEAASAARVSPMAVQ